MQRGEVVPVLFAPVPWRFALPQRAHALARAWWRAGIEAVCVPIPRRGALPTLLRERLGPIRGEERVVRAWPPALRPWWQLSEDRLEARMRRSALRLRRALDRRIDHERAAAIVQTPYWAPWLPELGFRHVVYDLVDELSALAPRTEARTQLAAWEPALLERADAAIVTAGVLGDELRRKRPGLAVQRITNGVDDAWFQERARELPTPPEYADVPRPIVGFVGALHWWVDFALMAAVADALPEVSFAYVGPSDGSGDLAALARRANVHLLGARPHAEVPAHVQAFDACWVPFRADAVGRAANPVKLYEYLALGKPVVATPLADLEDFEGLVACGASARELVEELRAALADPERDAQRRRAFAAQNSWTARAGEILQLLAALA